MLLNRTRRDGRRGHWVIACQVMRQACIAMQDLGLRRVAILYPGDRRYAIAERVEAVPLSELARRRPVFAAE